MFLSKCKIHLLYIDPWTMTKNDVQLYMVAFNEYSMYLYWEEHPRNQLWVSPCPQQRRDIHQAQPIHTSISWRTNLLLIAIHFSLDHKPGKCTDILMVYVPFLYNAWRTRLIHHWYISAYFFWFIQELVKRYFVFNPPFSVFLGKFQEKHVKF